MYHYSASLSFYHVDISHYAFEALDFVVFSRQKKFEATQPQPVNSNCAKH